MEDKYYLIKLANNTRYYGDTLTHCGSSIEIHGKEIPLVVKEDENKVMHDFLTNREIESNKANLYLNFYSHVDGLSYVNIAGITSGFLKNYRDVVATLTPEELELYNERLTEIENESKRLYEKNKFPDAFGLGQMMSMKLFKKDK